VGAADSALLAGRRSDESVMDYLSVRPTDQASFNRPAEVATANWEAFHKVWSDVLVDQEWKIERLHAVILNSQVRSPARCWRQRSRWLRVQPFVGEQRSKRR
jgi:hypothetical protein